MCHRLQKIFTAKNPRSKFACMTYSCPKPPNGDSPRHSPLRREKGESSKEEEAARRAPVSFPSLPPLSLSFSGVRKSFGREKEERKGEEERIENISIVAPLHPRFAF